MAYTLAAAAHDVAHPGYNNVFLIEKRDELANKYHDESVLESHHIAITFGILSKDKFNIFNELDSKEYKRIRK